jgi:splicing factor 3A subunit 3
LFSLTRTHSQVTSIADALSLHKALDSRKDGKWDRKTDEEYEDADGNVYNKKTYEDLRKHGLI